MLIFNTHTHKHRQHSGGLHKKQEAVIDSGERKGTTKEKTGDTGFSLYGFFALNFVPICSYLIHTLKSYDSIRERIMPVSKKFRQVYNPSHNYVLQSQDKKPYNIQTVSISVSPHSPGSSTLPKTCNCG